MAAHAKIIGVHPIKSDEPVHLIEMLVEPDGDAFDLDEVTQEVAGQPRSNWQSPYDEVVLDESEMMIRYAFFFHHADLDKPLLTPAGPLRFPKPTDLPAHLKDITYDQP